MKNIIFKSDNNSLDTVGINRFLGKMEEYDVFTDTTSFNYFCHRSSISHSKLFFAGTGNFGDLVALEKITFNQSDGDDTTVKDYSELVDCPFQEYINELNGFVFKVKSTQSEIIKRIVSFESLKQNWDGYGAYPLEVEGAANAINFINLLSENTVQQIDDVFPTPNGTVSIIWKNNSGERISFEIGNEDYSYYVKFNTQEPLFFNGTEFDGKEVKRMDQFVKSL